MHSIEMRAKMAFSSDTFLRRVRHTLPLILGTLLFTAILQILPGTELPSWAQTDTGGVPAIPAESSAHPTEAEPPAAEEPDSFMERTVEAIDTTHERLSAKVINTGEWIDSFFGDERVLQEAQRTRFHLGYAIFIEESEDPRHDVRARLRLTLPMLSDRLQLVLSGDPDREPEEELLVREDFRRLREPRERQITAGLRYFLKSTVRDNISLHTSLRVRGGTPVLLFEPRYRHSVPLDPWLFRFTQRLIGYSDGSHEARTYFDLERLLPEPHGNFFLRTTAEGQWFDDEAGYFYNLHFSLYQTLSPRRVLEYTISNYFQTRPNHRWEGTVLRVLYRQRMGRDWLFAEVGPQFEFPRERDFRATPGILLRLEAIFGAYE